MSPSDGKVRAGNAAAPGLAGILDLSSPLRRLYQRVLKEGDVSLQELAASSASEEREELRTHLNLLARLEYLEKYAGDGGGVRFRVKGRTRANSSLPDEIWKRIGGL